MKNHRLATAVACIFVLLAGTCAYASEEAPLEDAVTTLTGKAYRGSVTTLSRATLTIRSGEQGRPVTLRIDSVAKIELSAGGRQRLLEVREKDLLVLSTGKLIVGEIKEKDDKEVKIIPNVSAIETSFPMQMVKLVLEARTPLEAYESRRALLDVRRKDHLGHLELGLWCLAHEELGKQVFDELNMAIRDKRDYTEAYLQMSDLYQEKYERDLFSQPVSEDEYNEELVLYYGAIEAGIEHPVLLYRLGRVFQRLGQSESAISAFEKSMEANELLKFAWIDRECALEIGQIQFDLGESQKALRCFTDAVKEYPGHFRARYLAGLARLRLRHDDNAMVELDCAAEIEPFFPDVHVALAAGYYLLGVPNEVDRRIADAHGLGPPTVESTLLQALALIEVEHYNDAATAIDKALAIAPNDPDVAVARAYLAECRGETVAAIDAYGEAIELLKARGARPEEIGFLHYQRAGVSTQANLLNSAQREIEEALKKGFDPMRAFKLKGFIAMRSEKYDEAQRFLGYAHSIRRTPDLEYMLGIIAVKQQNLIEAEARFNSTLSYDKSHAGAIYGLGYVAHLRGDVKTAQQYFKQVSGLSGPGVAEAKEALARYAETDKLTEWKRNFTAMPDGKLATECQIDGYAGAVVGVEGGAAVIKCQQRDEGITSFFYEHKAPLSRFVLFEAVLEAPKKGEAVFGIELESRGRYIRFARDTDGTLVYNFHEEPDKLKADQWIKTEVKFSEDVHTLSIKLDDLNTGTFELLLDGYAIPLPAPLETMVFKTMTQFNVRVFGVAEKGVEWEARTRHLRVVFRGEARR